MKTISIHKFTNIPPDIIHWHLDSPKESDIHNDSEIKIRGWALGKTKEVKICVRAEGENFFSQYSTSENRPDVIKKILKESPTNHSQLTCGFNFSVKIASFEIGLLVNDKTFWVAKINQKDEEKTQTTALKKLYGILKNRIPSLNQKHFPSFIFPTKAETHDTEEEYVYPGITLEIPPSQAINEPKTRESFTFTTAKGAKILQTGNIEVTGKGYALANGENSHIIISSDTILAGAKIDVVGKNSTVLIGKNCRLRGVTIQIRGNDCLIVIGAGTTWESGAALCSDGKAILIGDDCMFSNQVILRTADGHSIWEAGGSHQINIADDVIIESHVWLGNSSRVSKGTRIGRGTIVGQCSLATGTLKNHCIYGGIPARLIKEKVEWSRTMAYEDIPSEYLFENNSHQGEII